jgi:hypothetical protein
MASDPGFQYKELYLFNFLLLKLAKRSARSIYSTCVTNSISTDIQWIPRSENEKADYISRLIDHEDWEVSGNLFDLMNGLWGPFTIDRFANFNNN